MAGAKPGTAAGSEGNGKVECLGHCRRAHPVPATGYQFTAVGPYLYILLCRRDQTISCR